MNKVTLRTELIKDYPQVAELHTRAFKDTNRSIAAMIALHRQNLHFDPELSLVAEVEGKVGGHVLFYPRDFRLGGELVKGVVSSPLGVLPDLQGLSIGGQLIVEGHKRAAEKGYAFSLVLGHPTYYPRFGYKTHMYGGCQTRIEDADVPIASLEERKVELQDIPFIQDMWHLWFGDNSLAFSPGDSLLDWISPHPDIRSVIVLKGGEAVGYLRYKVNEPLQPRFFLASTPEATSDLLGHIRALGMQSGSTTKLIQLPVHPESSRVKDWISFHYSAEVSAWDAGMVYILDGRNNAIHQYSERVLQKCRSIGSILWPVEFEIL
jgi:putative acetyltransferase